MKNFSILFFFSLLTFSLQAQNPIVPPGIYIADPSAHVWKDGKLYVYGSTDESTDYYCSYHHDVVYTTDMIHWKFVNNSFASKGSNDQVSYSDALLYAPDVQYKDGKYYLYYCLASNTNTEGVAVSDSPTGPFLNGKPINTYGYNQIDPCVFMDDDGQAYYIWGQFTAKMAKLKPNMLEIDPTTIKDSVVTEKEHFFHEGGYMVKRNGIYYFIYADMERAGRPTSIGYAMSRHPMGPFTYGGVIVDNDHCDPSVWNNHGSIVEFKGRWYVFYHRSTHNSVMMRKACVEPITFNDDGTINEVEMTTQGAGPALDATQTIDAERACLLYGNVRIQQNAPENEELAGIINDDKAAYKYINFGIGVNNITVRVAPGANAGKIDVVLGDSWSPAIGSVEVPGGGNHKVWKVFTVPVKETAGIHALWLRFYGEGEDLFRVDWLKFGNDDSQN